MSPKEGLVLIGGKRDTNPRFIRERTKEMEFKYQRVGLFIIVVFSFLMQQTLHAETLFNDDMESWKTNGVVGPPDGWKFNPDLPRGYITPVTATQEDSIVYEGNYSVGISTTMRSNGGVAPTATAPAPCSKTSTGFSLGQIIDPRWIERQQFNRYLEDKYRLTSDILGVEPGSNIHPFIRVIEWQNWQRKKAAPCTTGCTTGRKIE
jgi:hypothetical protein